MTGTGMATAVELAKAELGENEEEQFLLEWAQQQRPAGTQG